MTNYSEGQLTQASMLDIWRQNAIDLGFTDFVSAEDGFKSRNGKAWENAKSIGVYFWIAENGEAYVGQTIQPVRRRLLQHWANHRDMLEAAFQRVSESELDSVESDLIKRAGKLYLTRNIKHAIATASYVPLDQFLSAGERESFLAGKNQKMNFDWRDLTLLEQKQATRFRRIQNSPKYLGILTCLRTYVETCIPHATITEGRFWSVTVFPHPGVFLRVNAGQQEVFTVIAEEKNLITARVLAIKDMRSTDRNGPHYSTRSYAYYVAAEEFTDWLNSRRILACRDLVIHLMRHTTPLNNGSHCPQIVRAAFEAPTSRRQKNTGLKAPTKPSPLRIKFWKKG